MVPALQNLAMSLLDFQNDPSDDDDRDEGTVQDFPTMDGLQEPVQETFNFEASLNEVLEMLQSQNDINRKFQAKNVQDNIAARNGKEVGY